MLSPQHFSTQSVCSTFKNFARSFLFLKKTRGNQNLFWACYNVNKISRDLYWRWAKWKNKEELENWKWLPFLERKSNKDGQPQNRAWLVPMLKNIPRFSFGLSKIQQKYERDWDKWFIPLWYRNRSIEIDAAALIHRKKRLTKQRF